MKQIITLILLYASTNLFSQKVILENKHLIDSSEISNMYIKNDSFYVFKKNHLISIKLDSNSNANNLITFYWYFSKDFFLTKTIIDDFTGKGKTEVFTEQYVIRDTSIDIVRKIVDDNKNLLWYDSISVNKDPLFYFCNDSIGIITEPISWFFKAWFVSQISNLEKINSFDQDRITPLIHPFAWGQMSKRYEGAGYNNKEIEKLKEDFEIYCKNYKGYFISKLGFIDNDIYFYHPLNNKFEIFYLP